MKYIVLDSGPLGLITQRAGVADADACNHWLAEKLAQGAVPIVTEIIDYELRRELIRSGKTASLERLDRFTSHSGVIYIPLRTSAMKLAADLWAKARDRGKSTAHPQNLDIDVILAAQVLDAGLPPGEFVVATSNVKHLAVFVPANVWTAI